MIPTGVPGARATGGRVSAVDTLRTGLVTWIIAGHALLGYSVVGGWPYDEIHETTFGPRTELVLVAVLGPSGLFVIGVLFFVAGLFTPASIARRGPVRYALTRAARLGPPWVASALLVWPLFLWLAYRAAGRDVSYWWVFTHRDPLLDSGSLWFALVLLLFSLAYAAVHAVRGRRLALDAVRPVHVLAMVLAMAVTTFLVRLVFPARSAQPGDLHLWQWPQCAGMFLFGVLAGHGPTIWPVSARLVRRCGWTVVAVLGLFPVAALITGVGDLRGRLDSFLGGWRWQALATATVESVLVVCGSVALVGFAVRWLRPTRWHRAAFAAFVIQGPVLLVLATAARPLPWSAVAKASLVGLAAVAGCFAVGSLLVERTPLRRWLA